MRVDARWFLGLLFGVAVFAGPGVDYNPPGGGVSDHGGLSGLGDDDHSQYLFEDGTRAMSGDLDMGTNAVTNVGNIDGVDVSGHAARHTDGSDDIQDATNAQKGLATAAQITALEAIDDEALLRDGSRTITGDLVPSGDDSRSLGSLTTGFADIHTHTVSTRALNDYALTWNGDEDTGLYVSNNGANLTIRFNGNDSARIGGAGGVAVFEYPTFTRGYLLTGYQDQSDSQVRFSGADDNNGDAMRLQADNSGAHARYDTLMFLGGDENGNGSSVDMMRVTTNGTEMLTGLKLAGGGSGEGMPTVTLGSGATEIDVEDVAILEVTGDGGGNTVATLDRTNGAGAPIVRLLFVDSNVTIVDNDTPTAGQVNLAGASSDFTGSADDVLTVIRHDDGHWVEESRSVN